MNKVLNTVIALEKDGKRSVYIKVKKMPALLYPLMHKLRVKCTIYECGVYTYNPEMDFTHSISKGWVIVEDNRSTYVHDVKIVPAYSKSKKDEANDICPLCGQKKHKKEK